MTSLKTILMGSVAAISLAAAPALSQEATTDAAEAEMAQANPDRSFDGTYGDQFAAMGDRNVEELVGTAVVNDAGETIGEVDNFGMAGDRIVAIVGIGGFLGMGEHSVALPMERLTLDGEQLVISGVTREDLETLPEYNEGDAETFAADQSLRSGYEGAATPEMAEDTAAVQPSEDPAADEPMASAEDDVAAAAEAEMGESDTSAETMEGAGEDVAQAAGSAGAAVESAGDEAAQSAAEAGESAAAEIDQMADGARGEMSESGEVAAADSEHGWTEEMNGIFADIADQQIAELIGMEVAGADGEVVGEVDNFILQGDDVAAIVGVGGFLGIGEHEVALTLDEMTYDGEKLVLSSMTEEQLREMPEYDEAEPNYLPEDGTLRSSYDR